MGGLSLSEVNCTEEVDRLVPDVLSFEGRLGIGDFLSLSEVDWTEEPEEVVLDVLSCDGRPDTGVLSSLFDEEVWLYGLPVVLWSLAGCVVVDTFNNELVVLDSSLV